MAETSEQPAAEAVQSGDALDVAAAMDHVRGLSGLAWFAGWMLCSAMAVVLLDKAERTEGLPLPLPPSPGWTILNAVLATALTWPLYHAANRRVRQAWLDPLHRHFTQDNPEDMP